MFPVGFTIGAGGRIVLASDNALARSATTAITRADSLLRITQELGTLKRYKADAGLREALTQTRADLDSVSSAYGDLDFCGAFRM